MTTRSSSADHSRSDNRAVDGWLQCRLSQGERSCRGSGQCVYSARTDQEPRMMYSHPYPFVRSQRDSSREMESLLWLAAGAAWAVVALKAWSKTRKVEARRRTFVVSDRLLSQVFPH